MGMPILVLAPDNLSAAALLARLDNDRRLSVTTIVNPSVADAAKMALEDAARTVLLSHRWVQPGSGGDREDAFQALLLAIHLIRDGKRVIIWAETPAAEKRACESVGAKYHCPADLTGGKSFADLICSSANVH